MVIFRFALFVGIVSLLSAVPAYAEVMDKEPTVTTNWLWALVGGGLAIVAWRWRWWLGTTVSVLGLAAIYSMYLEITDPFVGPAIRAEAGGGYVTHFYWSAVVAVVLQLVAAYGGLRARRRFNPPAV